MTMAEGLDNGTVVETPAEGGHVDTAPGTGASEASQQEQPASQEEMIPASRYKALQSQWTKDHGELLALRQKAQTPASAPAQPAADGSPDITAALTGIVAPLQEKLAVFEIQSTLDRLHAQNPDTYESVAPEVQKILEANPKLWGMDNAVEVAFQIAEAQYIKGNLPKIVERVEGQKAKNLAEKQAGSDTKQRGAQPNVQSSHEDQVKASILAAARGNGSIFG